MKPALLIKVFLGIPLVLILDYIAMVFMGCGSCLFSFSDGFYCGTYCLIGKSILVVSLVLFIYYLLPDVKQYLNQKKNAASN